MCIYALIRGSVTKVANLTAKRTPLMKTSHPVEPHFPSAQWHLEVVDYRKHLASKTLELQLRGIIYAVDFGSNASLKFLRLPRYHSISKAPNDSRTEACMSFIWMHRLLQCEHNFIMAKSLLRPAGSVEDKGKQYETIKGLRNKWGYPFKSSRRGSGE